MKSAFVRSLSFAFAPLALALTAAAQGSDSCTTPTAISGEGSFAFNTTSATTGSQGQNESLCDQFGTMAITRDVWFSWTSPEDGTATISLCGGATFDTKLAAYPGSGCPASSALACNDDSCGVQSQIAFDVTSGSVYTIQLGSYPGAGGGGGSMLIDVGEGPPPCGENTGPDVIVGEITDVLNTSPVGTIDAIALGTTSCNMGSQILNWLANSNDHPVIRQNVYRYSLVDGASRFEQIGFSWLKHGFASLQGDVCCSCTGNGDGQHLGVGCSDPYDSGLNGSQSGLGPNWQVNAHTGVFTYPPAGGTGGSGNVYRRCQMLLTDMTPGGGRRFFGECQYVTKDDAAAGNQDNNASWRELSVSGTSSNYSMALTGITHRGDPAIRVWADLDTGVALEDISIPNDGLVVLGSRATQLTTNSWRYEYSVYNMNADRNIGSVSVPVDSSVTVTNVGFHGVTYRDGDGPGNINVSSTPWDDTLTGSALTWATETETQNSRANAIRWGTMYTFRFDADTAPQNGTITLGVWKAGSPSSVTGTGAVPSAGDGIAAFCFPDVGGVRSCPCGNPATAGDLGCDNFINTTTVSGTGGAKLDSTGTPNASVSNTFVFHVTGAHNPAVNSNLHVFWLGTSTLPVGVKSGFGVRCVAGALQRIYQGSGTGSMGVPSSNAVDFPNGTQTTDAWTASQMPVAGTTLYYYDSFRDQQGPTNCNTANDRFNVSHALSVTWVP